jgi:hypothetical protein
MSALHGVIRVIKTFLEHHALLAQALDQSPQDQLRNLLLIK